MHSLNMEQFGELKKKYSKNSGRSTRAIVNLLEYGYKDLKKLLSNKTQCVILKELHTSFKKISPRNTELVKWYQKKLFSVNSGL